MPYRLLVVAKDEEERQRITKELTKLTDSLPPRRLAIHIQQTPDGQTSLYDSLFATPAAITAEEHEKHILDCYKAWLAAWEEEKRGSTEQREPANYHLWIGLDREASQAREGWQDSMTKARGNYLKDFFVTFNVTTPDGKVFYSTKNDVQNRDDFYTAAQSSSGATDEALTPGEKYWRALRGEKEKHSWSQARQALVFDNHGKCFPELLVENEQDFTKSIRFYQKLTGSESADLFRLLSHPPSNEFGFAFFALSLAEACLANIAVVDERIANALLDAANGFADCQAGHQKAGVFPVVAFGHKNQASSPWFIDRGIEKTLEENAKKAGNHSIHGTWIDFAWPKEAEAVAKCATAWLAVNKNQSGAEQKSDALVKAFQDLRFDAIVIHEGIMDDAKTFAPNWDKEHREEFLQQLYRLAPAVIRTSGRGRDSKLLGKNLPFVEFSAISQATLTSRNKFSLARALFGATGVEEED
ncbi:MAG: hypothetical protein LBU39_08370 [Desulfobulbaceae bacterium]|nr:hypothetical protein [Desulfobulbaceae bacterium]